MKQSNENKNNKEKEEKLYNVKYNECLAVDVTWEDKTETREPLFI